MVRALVQLLGPSMVYIGAALTVLVACGVIVAMCISGPRPHRARRRRLEAQKVY
jgi:hypothetical protein